jgi:hypothetical protein
MPSPSFSRCQKKLDGHFFGATQLRAEEGQKGRMNKVLEKEKEEEEEEEEKG